MTEGNTPFLVTPRLELWVPREAEVEGFIEIVSNPETHRFLGRMGSRADHLSRIMRNVGSWQIYGYGILAIRRREDGALLGNCGIFHSNRGLGEDFDERAEAGWILAAQAVGKGYASEAMEAVFAWFDAEFGRETTCLIARGNTPSFRLAEKFGFALLREAEMPDGDAVSLLRRPPPSG